MSINNSATFDMGAGPDLKGTWKNYRTGDVITIRDTLFEDNKLVGVTTGGQMISYDRLQSYVKCDPSEANNNTTIPSRRVGSNVNKSRPSSQVKQFVDNIDSDEYSSGSFESTEDPLRTPITKHREVSLERENISNTPIPISQTEEDPAIAKVFDRLTSKQIPKIKIDIKWDEVPEGIHFLKKYLGIETEDIVKACCRRYIKIEDIQRELSTKLDAIIDLAIGSGSSGGVKKTSSKKSE